MDFIIRDQERIYFYYADFRLLKIPPDNVLFTTLISSIYKIQVSHLLVDPGWHNKNYTHSGHYRASTSKGK